MPRDTRFSEEDIFISGSGRTTNELEELREVFQAPRRILREHDFATIQESATPRQIRESNRRVDAALNQLEDLKRGSIFSKLFRAPARRKEIIEDVVEYMERERPGAISMHRAAHTLQRNQQARIFPRTQVHIPRNRDVGYLLGNIMFNPLS